MVYKNPYFGIMPYTILSFVFWSLKWLDRIGRPQQCKATGHQRKIRKSGSRNLASDFGKELVIAIYMISIDVINPSKFIIFPFYH